MNLSEFKAWFEGFTDGIDSNPSEKQWVKIKEKVATITANPTSPTVIREYWRDYWPRIQPNYDRWYYGGAGISGNMASADKLYAQMAHPSPDFEKDNGFAPSIEATFKAMGAADAAELEH